MIRLKLLINTHAGVEHNVLGDKYYAVYHTTMCLNLKRSKGAQLHSTVLVIREAQLRWHLSATIFECHLQSQAIEDTVKHSLPV